MRVRLDLVKLTYAHSARVINDGSWSTFADVRTHGVDTLTVQTRITALFFAFIDVFTNMHDHVQLRTGRTGALLN